LVRLIETQYAGRMPTRTDTSGPAERLLDTASKLFLREGIRAVGIDRIIAEAAVARASLYHAYGSKDGLITAFLEDLDTKDRASYTRAAARQADPVLRALLVFDAAARSASRRSYRGCPYLNALTEFPDSRHPVAAVVHRHREWMRGIWTEALAALPPGDRATAIAHLTLLYDGGLAGSKVTRSSEPIQLARTLAAAVFADRAE
jgi:AcrR family transcriptional regulator